MFGSRDSIEGILSRMVHGIHLGFAGWARAGLNLLLPPACVCCAADLSHSADDLLLCDDCRRRLGPETWSGCPRCAGAGAPEDWLPEGCSFCRRTTFHFDRVITLGSYWGQLCGVILRMKRPRGEPLSKAMGQWLARRRGPQLAEMDPNLVVPVPMHWTRRLQRGINSPEIVAGRLARDLGIPLKPRLLVRRRRTFLQTEMSPRQRFRNVRAAFRVRRSLCLQGARVLLVDDILTTGATCSEAARALKQAGAASVAIAVLARAQGQ